MSTEAPYILAFVGAWGLIAALVVVAALVVDRAAKYLGFLGQVFDRVEHEKTLRELDQARHLAEMHRDAHRDYLLERGGDLPRQVVDAMPWEDER